MKTRYFWRQTITFLRTNIVSLTFFVVTIFVAFKAAFLLYPDIAITYPFLSYDSFQWLADGLVYRGANLDSSYRQIGLPAVIAVLDSLNVLRFLPVVTCALLLLFMLALVKLLRPTYSPTIVALVLLLVGFNYRVNTFFDYVLADQWALTFMTISLAFLVGAVKKPRYWIPCIVFGAVSLLFQYAIIFSIPGYLLALRYALKESDSRARHIRHLCFGATVALIIIAPPFVGKWITKGSPFYSSVIHGQLVRPHFYSVAYYAFNFFAFLGIPAAILTIKGRHLTSPTSRILMAGLAGQVLFWIFFYVWHDVRFILYMVPFAAYFMAKGIELIGSSTTWRNAVQPIACRVMLVVIGLPLLLSYGFFNTGNPFAQNILPITPQCAIELSTESITAWQGNVTINFHPISLHYYTDRIPGFDAPIGYILRRWRIPESVGQELTDLTTIRTLLDSGQTSNRLTEAESLPTDYFNVMRRNLTLRRQPKSSANGLPILRLSAHTEESENTIFKGNIYSLDMQ